MNEPPRAGLIPTERLVLAAAMLLCLAVDLAGCSRPAPTAQASDAAPTVPSSDEGMIPVPSDAPNPPGPQAQAGGCYQIQVGGGWSPGVNGGPGSYTPPKSTTICPPTIQGNPPVPTPAPLPAPAPAPAPVPAGAVTADTD